MMTGIVLLFVAWLTAIPLGVFLSTRTLERRLERIAEDSFRD